MNDAIEIEGLMIYPVKSLPGLTVESVELDEMGFVNDRRYMLVDESGKFVSQRKYAQLALLRIEAVDGGWMITRPDGNARHLPFNGSAEKLVEVEVWGSVFSAFEQEQGWSLWFSDYLQAPVRLVWTNANSERRIDQTYCQDKRFVGFVDGFPMLLTSSGSLAALNEILDVPIDMVRFRPNIIVKHASAFDELAWRQLEGESLLLDVVKPCTRCVIPTIDPKTAEKQPQVWKAMKSLLSNEDGDIIFGQNVIHNGSGNIRVGESLKLKA